MGLNARRILVFCPIPGRNLALSSARRQDDAVHERDLIDRVAVGTPIISSTASATRRSSG
jgi:hypothetical protein